MTTDISGTRVSFLKVAGSHDGQRLDNFLLARLKGVPKSRLYRLLRKGEIRVNRKRAKPEYRVSEGDEIRLPPIRIAEREGPPEPSSTLASLLLASILYEDADIMILNKPSGLASHCGTGIRLGLIEAARQIWQDKNLELAHRLDRGTSGCIILSRSLAAGNHLGNLFRNHQVSKSYHALVDGRWPSGAIRVEAPLERLPARGGDRRVRVSGEGKPALTHFSLLDKLRGCSLVEARPASGRTHQIRVHAALQGHPLLGDDKYADKDRFRHWHSLGIRRLCLHARSLEFTAPSGVQVKIEAPYDDSFSKALATLA